MSWASQMESILMRSQWRPSRGLGLAQKHEPLTIPGLIDPEKFPKTQRSLLRSRMIRYRL